MVTTFMVIPNTVITICHLKTFLLVDSYCLFILNVTVNETLEMLWLLKLTTKKYLLFNIMQMLCKVIQRFHIHCCAVLFYIA